MKRYDSPLFGAVALLASLATWSACYAIFFLLETNELLIPGTWIWMIMLLSCYAGSHLFLRRERTLRASMLFCLAFFVAQIIVIFAVQGFFAGFFGIVVALGIWGYSYFKCYQFVQRSVTVEQLVITFELGVIVWIMQIFFFTGKQTSIMNIIPLTAGVILALFALILKRTARGRNDNGGEARGLAFMGGLLLLFAGIGTGFALAALERTKYAAEAFWAGLKGVSSWIGNKIMAFMQYLVSLIPEDDMGDILLEGEQNIQMSGGLGVEEELVSYEWLFYVLIAAVAVVVILLLVYALKQGGTRVAVARVNTVKRKKRNRKGLFSVFSVVLARWRAKLRYAVNFITKFNSVPGLFAWLEYRASRQHHGRKAEETCRDFLTRIAPAYPSGEPVLKRLSEELDAYYFGGKVTLHRHDIIKMRQKLIAAKKYKKV